MKGFGRLRPTECKGWATLRSRMTSQEGDNGCHQLHRLLLHPLHWCIVALQGDNADHQLHNHPALFLAPSTSTCTSIKNHPLTGCSFIAFYVRHRHTTKNVTSCNLGFARNVCERLLALLYFVPRCGRSWRSRLACPSVPPQT